MEITDDAIECQLKRIGRGSDEITSHCFEQTVDMAAQFARRKNFALMPNKSVIARSMEFPAF